MGDRNVRNSDLMTLDRNTVPRHAIAARWVGCACLVMTILRPEFAVAQAMPSTPILVNLLPGESAITLNLPVGTANAFDVSFRTSENFICNFPTAIELNAQLRAAAAFGQLQTLLSQLESNGPYGIQTLLAELGAVTDGKVTAYGATVIKRFTISQVAGGPYTHTYATGCLNVSAAWAVLLDIRRVIRAYLGLPAPTN
jgi:hypothetical protein